MTSVNCSPPSVSTRTAPPPPPPTSKPPAPARAVTCEFPRRSSPASVRIFTRPPPLALSCLSRRTPCGPPTPPARSRRAAALAPHSLLSAPLPQRPAVPDAASSSTAAPPRPASPPPAFPMANQCSPPPPSSQRAARPLGLPGAGGRRGPALTKLKAADPGATAGVSLWLARSPAVPLPHTTSKTQLAPRRCSPGLARRHRRAPSTARPSSAGVRSTPARGGRPARLRAPLHHSAAEAAGSCSLPTVLLAKRQRLAGNQWRVWRREGGLVDKTRARHSLAGLEEASFHVENCLWRGPRGSELQMVSSTWVQPPADSQ
ncbi:formin-like protein 5 [Sagmatias obliquidens]|uniref:formin-like protein 5 n=1 Tax=Sagmatias obliquidens TaxID=3371155 RepID=UPI000F445CC2|nr:formin-like protein 5 [Lagenorhynchus obliquidens]